jgi:hypothetical protein
MITRGRGSAQVACVRSSGLELLNSPIQLFLIRGGKGWEFDTDSP